MTVSNLINVTFILSKSSSDFYESDITVTNGTLTNFSGSGEVYTAEFNPTNTGSCSLVVEKDVYTNSLILNTPSNTFNIIYASEIQQDGQIIYVRNNNTIIEYSRSESAHLGLPFAIYISKHIGGWALAGKGDSGGA